MTKRSVTYTGYGFAVFFSLLCVSNILAANEAAKQPKECVRFAARQCVEWADPSAGPTVSVIVLGVLALASLAVAQMVIRRKKLA
ncbi:hypothetical protein [Nocardia grenadensis]|uniref:hypothetical protein n=1 Tax=Nocardia grenadensis TaxID=931537 RepID=UPI003D73DE6D